MTSPNRPSQVVEGSKARAARREVRLTAGMPRDPSYVFRRIFEAREAPRLVIDFSDKTGREAGDAFSKLVDLVQGNLWTKAALLKADPDTRTVVFSNGCVVTYKQ